MIDDPIALTPIQFANEFRVKRDDLFGVNGVPGGKVRTCLALAKAGRLRGAHTLVTAGSRSSPQVNIVAHVAQHLGMHARCHTPQGELSPEVLAAQSIGAEIIQHRAGYNSVIIARAHADAQLPGRVEIPFGMECEEAITQTRAQVANIPPDIKRIVMPVGSGMSMAGVLHGLLDCDLTDIPVLGVSVGASPVKRLIKYGPSQLLHGADWSDMCYVVQPGSDYHDAADVTEFGGISLDPHYEAKCIPFLKYGDLLWIVGIRATAL